METNEREVWFPAKRYGWGWGLPCAWQGWVVFVLWLALLCAGGVFLAPRHVGLFVLYSVGLATVLVLICLVKGERPRWRWGESGEPETRSSAERLAELEELRRRRLVSEAEYATKRREILRDI